MVALQIANSSSDEIIVGLGVVLLLLGFLSFLCFAVLLVVSLATKRVSRYWKFSFLCSSITVGGLLTLWTWQLRYGDGGVMVFDNTFIFLWSVIAVVLISALLTFTGRKRYIAIGVTVLTLLAFDLVVIPGMLTHLWLIRLTGRLR